MKTIVVATDFSPSATQAAHFSHQLARDQKANLLLVHAYQAWPDNAAKTGDFPLSVTAVRDSSEKALHQLADELNALSGADVPIQCIAQEGHAMDTICSVTKTQQADLLVMSTVGTAPQSARLMGSLATEMVAQTEVPLLLIPPHVGYNGLKNAVLCIDLENPPNAIAFEKGIGLASALGCVLNVLCISNNPNDAQTQQEARQIRRLLGHQPHTLSIESGGEIYDTILAFAHTSKADLIMMLPQTRNWFWKLIDEGETQRLARLTDLPLLAIV